MTEKNQRHNETLNWLNKRLSQQHPVAVVQRLSQRLDDVEQRLNYAWRYSLQQQQGRHQQLRARLQTASPELAVSHYQHRLQILGQNLHHHIQQTLERQKARLQNNARTLSNSKGETIINSNEISVGDELQTLLYKGKIISQVKKITT